MSTLKVNTIKNTSDVEKYLAQAWVNFNGTGTVAIRASGNVTSITDNGVGDYSVNFTTAFTDTNYVIGVISSQVCNRVVDDVTARTTSLIRIRTIASSFALTDDAYIGVTAHR